MSSRTLVGLHRVVAPLHRCTVAPFTKRNQIRWHNPSVPSRDVLISSFFLFLFLFSFSFSFSSLSLFFEFWYLFMLMCAQCWHRIISRATRGLRYADKVSHGVVQIDPCPPSVGPAWHLRAHIVMHCDVALLPARRPSSLLSTTCWRRQM